MKTSGSSINRVRLEAPYYLMEAINKTFSTMSMDGNGVSMGMLKASKDRNKIVSANLCFPGNCALTVCSLVVAIYTDFEEIPPKSFLHPFIDHELAMRKG